MLGEAVRRELGTGSRASPPLDTGGPLTWIACTSRLLSSKASRLWTSQRRRRALQSPHEAAVLPVLLDGQPQQVPEPPGQGHRGGQRCPRPPQSPWELVHLTPQSGF